MRNLFSLSVLMVASLFSQVGKAEDFSPKFYAFYNGLGFGDIKTEALALKEIGYDGISTVMGAGYGQIPQLVEGYEDAGLHVLSLYMNVDEKPLPEVFLTHLKGKDAMVEVTVAKRGPNTVQALRESAVLAQEMNIKLSLYPHLSYSVETIPQALDLIKEVNHPNIGLSFNLCHFLIREDVADLEKVITQSAPHLLCVNINGANMEGNGLKDFLLPLNEGTFPQVRLLKALKGISYKGPVGLQCYGVKGGKLDYLKTAYETWQGSLRGL